MIYVLIGISIFILDLFIKENIEKKRQLREEELIWNDKIILTKYHNKGAMLNFLEKNPKRMRGIATGVLAGVLLYYIKILGGKSNIGLKIGFSFLVGGACSNLFDRYKRGYVVDYFSFNCKWKCLKRIIFNISDIFIFVGSLLWVVFHQNRV